MTEVQRDAPVRVRASVLIPTHDRPDTLELAVASVLAQSVAEVEVLIIGDGVTDAVRERSERLAARDARVRFFNHPKGPNHGENYRDDAIRAARSDAIFYLCDDDLLLPDHVADLLELLEHANFAQSINGYFTTDGDLRFQYGDLADPDTIAMILSDDVVPFNSAAITGTAHSREFYLRAGVPWETTPAGSWPDHYQWRRLMRHPDFRGATSSRMTVLQFPTTFHERAEWTQARRAEEMRNWSREIARPGAQQRLDELVRTAMGRQLRDQLRSLDLVFAQKELLQQQLGGIQASISWRITRPMRALRRRLGRH